MAPALVFAYVVLLLLSVLTKIPPVKGFLWLLLGEGFTLRGEVLPIGWAKENSGSSQGGA